MFLSDFTEQRIIKAIFVILTITNELLYFQCTFSLSLY